MKKIILSEYNAIPENYRGIWTVEAFGDLTGLGGNTRKIYRQAHHDGQ